MADEDVPGPSRPPKVPRRELGGDPQPNGARALVGDWKPRDLSHITDPAELREALITARSDYRDFLIASGRAPEARFLNTGENDPLGRPERVDPLGGMLFTYSAEGRVHDQLGDGQASRWGRPSLRVSGGAPNEFLHQEGGFARGPYGTTIPPFSQQHDRRSMGLNFFGHEWSMPSVTQPDGRTASFGGRLEGRLAGELYARPALPTANFVAFAQNENWIPGGRMNFPETRQYGDDFLHFHARTPDRRVGDFVPQDIIAYGNVLIPNGRGPLRGGQERANELPTFTRRAPETIDPLNEWSEANNDPWAGATRPSRRFSIGSAEPRSSEYIQTAHRMVRAEELYSRPSHRRRIRGPNLRRSARLNRMPEV